VDAKRVYVFGSDGTAQHRGRGTMPTMRAKKGGFGSPHRALSKDKDTASHRSRYFGRRPKCELYLFREADPEKGENSS